MAQVSGITIERTTTGRPVFARIDLRKHSDIIPILENKGAELGKSIKWTEKLQNAFKEKEYRIGDINNFWDE